MASMKKTSESIQFDILSRLLCSQYHRYSGVRRQDFPPLTSSNNKYTPPARRAPTGQSTVSGAPVDPAIISSQLARPDKPAAEKAKPAAVPKAAKPEVSTPPTTTE